MSPQRFSGVSVRIRGAVVVGVALATLAASPARGDWTQWRGVARDGVVTGYKAPAAWPKELAKSWEAAVGTGHATPLVVGERVFVFSRLDDAEGVSCLRLADGQALWRKSYPAPYKVNPVAEGHGKGPKSTPVYHDGQLITLGISGILTCWKADSGAIAWQKDFGQIYQVTAPLYGTSTSPVIHQGACVVHVGGHGRGALTAYDLRTGEVKWNWTGDGPGYASPVIGSWNGRKLVVSQSQEACVAIGADDGRLVWRIPFSTEYTQNIVTPLIVGANVVFSGINKGTWAVDPAAANATTPPKEVWRSDDLSMYMSSPVLVGERIVGYSHRMKGQLVALNARDGKTLWKGAGRQGENAALVVAGEHVFALTTNGELIVVDPRGAEYRELARWKVAETATWAHPVLVGDRVLIKDQDHLRLWSWSGQ